VTLRREQERVKGEARTLQEQLTQVNASLDEWQAVLDIAIRFAADWSPAYIRANDPVVSPEYFGRPAASPRRTRQFDTRMIDRI
jgi:hypothetical protein